MSITGKVIGLSEIQAYLLNRVPQMKVGVKANLREISRLLINEIKVNYLTRRSSPTEPKLNARTGTLRRSIASDLIVRGNSDTHFTLVIGSNLNYAKFNHEGAVIPARRIFPKRKKALAWLPNGDAFNRFTAGALAAFKLNKKNFTRKGTLSSSGKAKAKRAGLRLVAKWVDIPTTRIPARPFLTAVLEKHKFAISRRLFSEMNMIFRKK